LGLGFFSLSHKVFDITPTMNRIYKNHDANSLKNLMEHTSERLASHVYSSYLKIEDSKWNKKRLITEIDLSDLVKDVYEMADEGKYIRKLS
jgi:hypothetical protein